MNTNAKRAWLEVAAQISGLDADEVVSPHHTALNSIFRKRAAGPYSTQVDQFAFVLRVDGCVRSWNLPLLSHIEYKKKWRGISIDVHVPGKVWKSGHVLLAKHISEAFREGIDQMKAHLQSKKIDVCDTELCSALEASLIDYTAWASALK